MTISYSHVPYRETGYFSNLVTDYLSEHANANPFYKYAPNVGGLSQAIADRSKYPVNRAVLVSTLKKQYERLNCRPKTEENIQLLLDENTFTVCTAHQPNLLTGYLYFIYKILHAIKLAEELKQKHPEKNFVPVFYMGSEDNDIEELGTFRFGEKKFVWTGDGQKGAVGRMNTRGLKPLLNDLFKLFGPPGKNCDELEAMLSGAYLKHDTISEATQYLVNELFGQYGLVVLNPDDAALKSSFIPVMEDELLKSEAYPIVTAQMDQLSAHYKTQAQPRAINLFYLSDNLRDRIEKEGDKYVVVGTAIQWSQSDLVAELKQHPGRFSPNVVLRGLYQETILPNVAFIGGGAELAYWLQLKPLFEHYGIFYPCIYLRQSVLWAESKRSQLRKQLGFSVADIFRPAHELETAYIAANTTDEWNTHREAEQIAAIFESLKKKANGVDPTLKEGAEAALAKMTHQLETLQKKMLRAEKRKMQVQMQRIRKLKGELFPSGSLQERVENFSGFYLQHGRLFFDIVKDGINAAGNQFLVIEKES